MAKAGKSARPKPRMDTSRRRRQIDDIVDAASGSLQERDMPRKKKK